MDFLLSETNLGSYCKLTVYTYGSITHEDSFKYCEIFDQEPAKKICLLRFFYFVHFEIWQIKLYFSLTLGTAGSFQGIWCYYWIATPFYQGVRQLSQVDCMVRSCAADWWIVFRITRDFFRGILTTEKTGNDNGVTVSPKISFQNWSTHLHWTRGWKDHIGVFISIRHFWSIIRKR